MSTPDLLLDVPDAHWLPLVVDDVTEPAGYVPFSRDRNPVVLHAPSRAALKGSAVIDHVLSRLADEGVIDYLRVSGLRHREMLKTVADADIIVDQLGLGTYGVLACEAMARGRVVIADPSEFVRAVVRRETGHELPVIDTSPAQLEDTIRSLCANPHPARERAVMGPAFVSHVHDGRRAAATLSTVFELGPTSTRMDV
ncbi:glycosyltransferase [Microcella sp.]|uniref:glycosyltransferase n=1 Tax=Microcella sp. TaxID=1913979 RepID=UPI00391C2366